MSNRLLAAWYYNARDSVENYAGITSGGNLVGSAGTVGTGSILNILIP
ncbi:MAG: hypothetical protein WD059_02875 [Balneolaceae bacterium]